MKLHVIVAHPDDAAIFCGGLLAKHARRGDDVHVTYLTRGELGGTAERSQTELAETRAGEARDASKHLGVSTSFLDFKDGRLEYSLKHRTTLTELIRKHNPDLLLTHFKDDPHPDHRITAQLVTDAYYTASLPLFETDHDATDPDNVYFFGKSTTDFNPDVLVDITEHQSDKEDAIREHQSQVTFLEQHGGIDAEFNNLIEGIRAEARVLGRRCGVQYAEGFSRLHDVAADYLGEPGQ